MRYMSCARRGVHTCLLTAPALFAHQIVPIFSPVDVYEDICLPGGVQVPVHLASSPDTHPLLLQDVAFGEEYAAYTYAMVCKRSNVQ